VDTGPTTAEVEAGEIDEVEVLEDKGVGTAEDGTTIGVDEDAMGERDEEGAAEDEATVWLVATPDAGAKMPFWATVWS
jgi:hypothetical protein